MAARLSNAPPLWKRSETNAVKLDSKLVLNGNEPDSIGGLILLVSPLAAVVAIRSRGDHIILATIGLLLSAFQIGAIIGLVTFSVLTEQLAPFPNPLVSLPPAIISPSWSSKR